MKKIIIALLLCAMPGLAFAQSANSRDTSNASSSTLTNTAAQAGGGSVTLNSYGGPPTLTETLRSAPTVYAPSIVNGGNACTGQGVSGAGSGIPIGIAIGFQGLDGHCEKRQDAAMAYNMGLKRVALAIMCEDPTMKKGILNAGMVCPSSNKPAPVQAAAYREPHVINDTTGTFSSVTGKKLTEKPSVKPTPNPAEALADTTLTSDQKAKGCHFIVVPPQNRDGAAQLIKKCD